jgi:hypothetical protein
VVKRLLDYPICVRKLVDLEAQTESAPGSNRQRPDMEACCNNVGP